MCDAKIRPLPNNTEIQCRRDGIEHTNHRGLLEDQLFPGSETIYYWLEDDRRNFRGMFVNCLKAFGCILPGAHRGECVLKDE